MSIYVKVDNVWKNLSGNVTPVIYACGRNNYGQLGLGDITDRSTPIQVGSDTNWQSVSGGGDNHTLAIKTNGTLWACGHNGYGQLGHNNITNQSTPIQVGTATDWQSVSCGHYHTLATKTNGTLWACGVNNHGQLGHNNITNRSTPIQVGTDTNWQSVSCGYYHTAAIKLSTL
jgi:alpha-tubulin suppressor-like RCC1 family protein